MQTTIRLIIRCLALGLAVAAGNASASLVTFYGADNGVVAGPSSIAALNNFTAAAGTSSLVNFQGPLPDGLQLTVTGNAGGVENQDQHTPSLAGFNIGTGSKWLQMAPELNSSTGATATFTFASAINAFGAFLTDTQTGYPGNITFAFDDGTSHSLDIGKNDDSGGVLFFGFTDIGQSFTTVTVNTGATTSVRDIFGIDNVRYVAAPAVAPSAPVSEPASLALLGLGLVGIAAARRKP